MKKHIVSILIVLLMFITAACKQSEGQIPLENLPDNYSLKQAKKDGCVTHENGAVTHGKEIFEAFYQTAQSGKPCEVRLANYYTLDDPSTYDPEYYASVKDDYSCLYIHDLSFDGEQYTIRWYEGEEEIVREYSYLMKYEGPPESPYAVYKSYIRYVLTDDDTVTWQELMNGLVSSQLGEYIAHQSVCTELFYE